MKSFYDYSNEYACGGDRSYFAVYVPADEEIKHYQVKMIENNKIDLLLPLSVQRINDDWRLFYDITSKIPLSRILERKPITQAVFVHIMRQIIRLTRELKDYLLDLTSVVFDTSFIYCDPSEFDLYFIYLPVELCENEQETLKTFLKKLLVEDINLSDDSSGIILKRLLGVLKEENLSIEKIDNCIQGEETSKKPLVAYNETVINSREKINEDTAAKQRRIEIPGVKGGNITANKPADIPDSPEQREKEQAKNEKHDKGLDKNIARKKSFMPFKPSNIIIGIVDFVFLVAFIALATSPSFWTANVTGKIAGTVLIFASINYFLFTRLAPKEGKNSEDKLNAEKQVKPVNRHFVNKEIDEDIILPQRPKKYTEREATRKSLAEDMERTKGMAGNGPKYEMQVKTNNIRRTVPDKTVVLGKANTSFHYLQNIACSTDRIRLDKDSILIGRLKDSVDHVIQNNAVGKIHAELIEREGQYFVIDLNSVNGTYINGEKIICNKPAVINNGDKITFANESYTFIKV